MTADKPRLYTAGAMDWHNDEDSSWRESVDAETDAAEFLHPTETYFDHGGDLVGGAVSEDMSMINRCDGVVALLSTSPQIGTVTEIVHAAAIGKPVLVFTTPDILTAWDPEEEEVQILKEEEGPWMRANSQEHWFLLNYLLGDSASGRVVDTGANGPPAWVRDWEGANAIVLKLQEDDPAPELIQNAIESWMDNSLEDVNIPTAEEYQDSLHGLKEARAIAGGEDASEEAREEVDE